MKIASKLPGVGTTIFATMTALANAQGAINLSQGFPDFDVDPELVARVGHYMRHGHNQYAPMQGVLQLRERIAAKILACHDRQYNPESEITITAGATEALFAAICAVVRPGDEVVIIEPAYDSYAPAVELNGGSPVYIAMRYPDYRIDWDQLAQSLSARTRLIIINSPHNPSGAVFDERDIQTLQHITQGTDVLILSDEVYEHIIFDGRRHESMARYPQLAERSFVVGSFGKMYHATGWKTGYCLAPPALTAELRRVHQFLVYAANTPIQYAYADYLADSATYIELAAFYQQKRDRFLSMLAASRFKPLACGGTYFIMLDYSAIADENNVDFARRLTVEHKVAAIPPSAFYHHNDDHHVLRFCFAKKDQTLEQAAERLCRI